jgi:dipeptidyl aminopeptidase/acylaminoacyl peptidase
MKSVFLHGVPALLCLHLLLVGAAFLVGQMYPTNILLYGNFLLDIEKRVAAVLLPHDQDIQGSSWSPDGRFILMTTAGTTAEETAAWVIGANGRQRHFISDTGYQYVWSPDSTQIAYLNWLDQGKMALHLYDLGTQQSHWLLNYQAYGSDLVWSPDGESILLTSSPPQKYLEI